MTLQAILWEKDDAVEGGVLCLACAHGCRIRAGAAGRCRVRINKEGALYSLSSGRILACNLDPVEKKPLFHFLPGTTTLSFGTPGCNMTCAFCQNHALSQGTVPRSQGTAASLPESLVAQTTASAREAGAASVSFTYNEPCVSPELLLAVAPRARDAGLETIIVSNAYAGAASMAAFRDCVRAANFDLKSFNDAFYAKLCGARLAPVLRTIVQAVSFGWWVEITTLLIPGHNDSDAELRNIAAFIKENLGAHVPWHISRFHPMFRMPEISPTPVAALERARAVGVAEGLHFVYVGNIPGHEAAHTRCPACGVVVLHRAGHRADRECTGLCPSCGYALPGVWRAV